MEEEGKDLRQVSGILCYPGVPFSQVKAEDFSKAREPRFAERGCGIFRGSPRSCQPRTLNFNSL